MRESINQDAIKQDFMVFFAEGNEGVGAVREVTDESISVYVENCGEFLVPLTAVKSVHDQKVLVDPHPVSQTLLRAVAHAHDAEDPKLAG